VVRNEHRAKLELRPHLPVKVVNQELWMRTLHELRSVDLNEHTSSSSLSLDDAAVAVAVEIENDELAGAPPNMLKTLDVGSVDVVFVACVDFTSATVAGTSCFVSSADIAVNSF
jgi:hypothetical protein